jgi:Domain of unknown function (DUF6484)
MKKQAKVRTRPAMQTTSAAQSSAQATTQTASLFDTLLVQQPAPQRQDALIHGVAVATLLELLPDGKVRIALPAHGIADLRATPVCSLHALREGEQVAVMFEQGDTSRALVLGPMAGAPRQAPAHEALIDNERIVIEAAQEIELRCGEAAIILTRDGRILLRGSDITSHASSTQRIRGGSVQIN